MPESPIEPVANFRKVALKMFFRYPTMRSREYRFRIRNNPMSPRKKSHSVFLISKDNAAMNYSQLICNGLVTTPSVCANSFNQWCYFIIRNTHSFQHAFDCFRRSIINYKGVSKAWMLLPIFIGPGKNCNDYQFLFSAPLPLLPEELAPKKDSSTLTSPASLY